MPFCYLNNQHYNHSKYTLLNATKNSFSYQAKCLDL
jgi:hypothetical protein